MPEHADLFERPAVGVLAELTDQEATMLAVGMLLLLSLRDEARREPDPERRYEATLSKLALEMQARALRRF